MDFGEDLFYSTVESLHRYGAFFAGFDESSEELLTVNDLARSVTFDDSELGAFYLLVGSVAVGALQALSSATGGGAVFRHSGVDDFVIK